MPKNYNGSNIEDEELKKIAGGSDKIRSQFFTFQIKKPLFDLSDDGFKGGVNLDANNIVIRVEKMTGKVVNEFTKDKLSRILLNEFQKKRDNFPIEIEVVEDGFGKASFNIRVM